MSFFTKTPVAPAPSMIQTAFSGIIVIAALGAALWLIARGISAVFQMRVDYYSHQALCSIEAAKLQLKKELQKAEEKRQLEETVVTFG